MLWAIENTRKGQKQEGPFLSSWLHKCLPVSGEEGQSLGRFSSVRLWFLEVPRAFQMLPICVFQGSTFLWTCLSFSAWKLPLLHHTHRRLDWKARRRQPRSQAPPPTEQAFLCSKNTVTLSYWYSYRLSPNPYSLATYLASSKNDSVVVWWSIFFHFFWFFPSNAHSHRTKILISPKIVPVFLGKTR